MAEEKDKTVKAEDSKTESTEPSNTGTKANTIKKGSKPKKRSLTRTSRAIFAGEKDGKDNSTKPKAPAIEEKTPEELQEFLDSFDWTDARDVDIYSEEERKKYAEDYRGSLNIINKNEIVKGTVVAITDKDVVLNIGFKSDGLVPVNEFREDPTLKIKDKIEVFVVDEEDSLGQLVLSRKNAKLIRAWEQIVESYNKGTIIEGTVISKTKGGLVVNVNGFETFLPGSQIDVKPITDYDFFVGKKMEFKVVKINEAIRNAVVSHKAIIESELESQRTEIITKLEKGQVLEGIIKNITDFGAFINLGGVDGLLFLSDISWGRIGHPSEVLELNQKLNVVILDFDDEKKRISLGLKQLQPHPWDVLDEKLTVGSKVNGKVVNIEDYGAFLEIIPGVEGLVHVSETSWALQAINPKEYFNIGDTFEALIVTMNREDRKMSLSIKQLTDDPWENIEKKYPVGSKHKGKVVNITSHGAFLELEDGIGGLVYVTDFSWTKKINHPSEFVKMGDELEIMVLNIDLEARRFSIGHKQLGDNPWTGLESKYTVGSIHHGKIEKIEGRDAVVSLPDDITISVPLNAIKADENAFVNAGDEMDFEIVEFDVEKHRVKLVSPKKKTDSAAASDSEVKEEVVEKPKKKSPRRSATYEPKSSVEKTTLGDFDVLSKIKEQMESSEQEAEDKSKPEPDKVDEVEASKPESTSSADSGDESTPADTPEVETPKDEEKDAAEESDDKKDAKPKPKSKSKSTKAKSTKKSTTTKAKKSTSKSKSDKKESK